MNKLNIKDNNYALEVLSYYLWGQSKAPAPAEIADEKFIRPASANTTVQIDAQEYMDQIARPNFELGEVGIFKTFFSGKTRYQEKNERPGLEEVPAQKITVSDLENIIKTRQDQSEIDGDEYALTHDEFVKLFYQKTLEINGEKKRIDRKTIDAANKAELPLYHYTSNSQSEDYWMRAFTFGSTKFELNKEKIRYVFDKNGNPLRLENVSIKPMDDDFDFVSSTGTAEGLNPLMEKMMDPSGIGRTVKFEFIDGKTSEKSKDFYSLGSNGTYTAQDYKTYLNAPKYSENYLAMRRGLQMLHSSNVYNYLDDKNRLVIFGTNSTDNINKTVTAKKIDLNNILSLGGSAEAYLNIFESSWVEKYQKYIENGIVYVAGNGDDTVIGTDYNDRLLTGEGNDTLKGLEGNDHMEGGIGFDTYYIEDSDTVVDSDGKGQIIFRESGLLASAIRSTVQAGHFVRSEGETEIWNSADENGKTDNRLTARKIGNDLEIWRSNSINDKVLIKNFFRQASAANNGSLSLLGITLADAVPTEERPFLSAITYTGEANLYNTFNLSGQQRFNIIGGSKDDLVFANGTQAARIDAGAGNDRIYGSYGADTIYGGSGSDYINGSPGVIAGTNRTAEQQAEDRDFLVGGAGRDVVVGMAGDDIIHTGEVGEHLLTAGSGEAGDVASGGLGNDKIYGSIANDLLAGSEGGDTVYGGAGDDVILGDALYRLASRSLTVYQESTITGPEYGPGIVGTGYVAPPSHHTPRVGMEHNYSNGKWAHQVTNVASRSHPDMDKWTVSIDREKGDYAFSSPIPAINEDHRLAAGGGADYLYGGYGNDLIIGQDGNDFLYGESGNDILWGDDNRDLSVAGDDYLDGGDDNDTLYGGGGTDTLIGGRGSDTLYGGTGFDTYLFHASDLKYGNDIDTIDDEDGQGRIVVDGTALDGLTWQRQDGAWRSGRFSLSQTGSELHVAVDGWQNGITVRNFANGTLGLNLPAQQPEPPAAQPKPETPNPRLPETPALPDLPAETKPQEPSVNPDLPETPILPTNPSNTEQPLTPLPPNNPGNPPANAEPATPPAEPNHPIPTETPVLPTNPSNTGGQIPPMLPDNPAYSVAPAPVVPPKPVKAKRRLSVFGRRKEQVVNSYSSWKQKAEDKVSSGILSWKRRRAAKKAATATAPLQPQQPASILPPSHSPFKRHRRVAASVGTSAALAHIPQQAVALTHAMAAFGNGQGSAASGTVSAPPNPAAILTTPSA